MRIVSWYNLPAKAYEAVEVGRGRPVRQDAPLASREKSSREFFNGKTKDECLMALATAKGLTLDEVKAAVVTDSKVVYKGKREMPYNSKKKADAT